MKKTYMTLPAAVLAAIVGTLLVPATANAAPVGPAQGAVAYERGVTIHEGVAAALTVEGVEGGDWRYGTRSTGILRKEVYSDFLHKTRKHGSSVKDGNNTLRRSADTAKNKWSRVSFKATANSNKAYYRFVK